MDISHQAHNTPFHFDTFPTSTTATITNSGPSLPIYKFGKFLLFSAFLVQNWLTKHTKNKLCSVCCCFSIFRFFLVERNPFFPEDLYVTSIITSLGRVSFFLLCAVYRIRLNKRKKATETTQQEEQQMNRKKVPWGFPLSFLCLFVSLFFIVLTF